jgi:choline-glycine betaine transporter
MNRAWLAAGLAFVMVISGGFSAVGVVADLAAIPGVVWLVCVVCGFRENARQQAAIREALGFSASERHIEPPRDPDGYRRWCTEKGLEPYPFRTQNA